MEKMKCGKCGTEKMTVGYYEDRAYKVFSCKKCGQVVKQVLKEEGWK